MNFEIPVDSSEVDYITNKLPLVTQKLSIALALLLQDLHRREVVPLGKGMDATAVAESARKLEEARRAHDAMFGTEDERREKVAQIQASTRLNTMIPRER
jgi:hypothetical protein